MSLTQQEKQIAIYGGGNTNNVSLLPRYKFNFRLTILSKVFDRVKSVNISDIGFETQIANQYNIKRVIQKKVNYGVTNIAFYDTYDNEFKKILTDYYKNYYDNGGFESIDDPGLKSEVITENFRTNIGYNTNNSTNSRYFFNEIKITQTGYNTNVATYDIKLKNCLITNVNIETFDYSDSSPSLFNITFQPEYVSYQPIGRGIDIPLEEQLAASQSIPSLSLPQSRIPERTRQGTLKLQDDSPVIRDRTGRAPIPPDLGYRGAIFDGDSDFNMNTTTGSPPSAQQTTPPLP
jgi:hypothetical protein